MDFAIEPVPDMEATAALARRAFGHEADALAADRFRWTYESGFDGAIVMAATHNGDKIGQGAFVFQQVQIAGRRLRAAQFVDLFVDPARRAGGTVRGIYSGLVKQAESREIGLIFATPNPAARDINRKLMGLADLATIPFRAGVVLPFRGSQLRSFAAEALAERMGEIEPYCQPMPATRFLWSPEALVRRLTGHPHHRYSLHLSPQAMLVASPRTIRGMPVLLATCFLPSGERLLDRPQTRSLLSAAAAFHRRPVFVYAGINTALATPPGLAVPARVKPPILLQGRALASPDTAIVFDRCELLDFDFI
jgi:predicted N-acetyltransferase YhbS